MVEKFPEILYKYRTITEDDRKNSENAFTKKLLADGELYFPPFDKLNDPNEALFVYPEDTDIAVTEEELNNYSKENIKEQESLPDGRYRLRVDGAIAGAHVLARLKQNLNWGVLCLTEVHDDLLMFDYYAGGHKGICIGFDWKSFGIFPKGSEAHQRPVKVKYSDIPPLIGNDLNDINEIFHTKWREYNHEQEWRLFYVNGIFNERINVRKAINRIIFATLTSEEDKKLVKSWVKDLPNITFYQAKLKSGQYSLDVIKIV